MLYYDMIKGRNLEEIVRRYRKGIIRILFKDLGYRYESTQSLLICDKEYIQLMYRRDDGLGLPNKEKV